MAAVYPAGMSDTALLLDRDARPLPPWKQRPDLGPMSNEWTRTALLPSWRRVYDAMPPAEQEAYRSKYPAPLYWYWFYGDGGPGSRLLVLATFPLWGLVWAIVKTLRGAFSRSKK